MRKMLAYKTVMVMIGGGYSGEGYKKWLCFEGDTIDNNGEINDNASKGLDDDSNP